jgi:hypothetical protein
MAHPGGRPRKYADPLDQKVIIRITREQLALAELLGVQLNLAGTQDVFRFLLDQATGKITPIDPPAPGAGKTQEFEVSPDHET